MRGSGDRPLDPCSASLHQGGRKRLDRAGGKRPLARVRAAPPNRRRGRRPATRLDRDRAPRTAEAPWGAWLLGCGGGAGAGAGVARRAAARGLGAGSDHLYGNSGADLLSGGEGNDSLWALAQADLGLPGVDTVRGEAGNDSIHTRDGEPDLVFCGPGKDTAALDAVDVIVDATPQSPKGSCENVKRAAPGKNADSQENRRESPPEDQRQS